MGIFTRRLEDANRLTAAAATAPAGVTRPSGYYPVDGIASLTPNNLETITLPDVLADAAAWGLTPAQAMSVPAVMAALNLTAGQVSRQPLKAYKDGVEVATQPTFLYRTNGAVSPQMRVLFTLQDLMLTGEALWLVTRGADGAITDAARCPRDRWRVGSKDELLVDGQPVDAADVLYFYGPVPGGLIGVGGHVIRQAQQIDRIRMRNLRTPHAASVLYYSDELQEDEVKALRDNIADALRGPNGGVVVLPKDKVDLQDFGATSADVLEGAQNAVAVYIAQFFGVPPELIQAAVASGSSASVTYQNLENQRSWWLDTGFALWASAISSRLSMDDVIPRGQSVDFDLTNLVAIPQTGEPTPRED